MEDQEQVFLGLLYREIKKKLWSGLCEDPDVNIDLSVDQDVFMMGLGRVTPSRKERGREVFRLKSNCILDSFLRQKLDERIFNRNGDFAYVIAGTVKYWLGQRNPVTDFKLIGGQYINSEIENYYFHFSLYAVMVTNTLIITGTNMISIGHKQAILGAYSFSSLYFPLCFMFDPFC